MTYYYCHNCELVLKEQELDRATEYVRSEYFGSHAMTASDYLVCGACGSDVEEVCVCERCKSERPVKGSDECASCQKESELEEKLMLDILMPLAANCRR